jgi:CheY-like chemotaxis protein
MDTERFADGVRDALARFHDRAHLQTQPLAALLLPGPLDGQQGARLQRLLRDAIDELRPEAGGHPGLPQWRRYRYLVLRYIEGLTHEAVVERLGISYRQGHRDHHEAVEGLVALLWSRRRSTPSAGTGGEAEGSGYAAAHTPSAASLLEAELLKLSESGVRVPTSLPAVLDAVLGTISGLAATKGVPIRSSLPPGLPPVAINAAGLRHALLELMSYLLESAARSEERDGIAITAAHDRGVVRLWLTGAGIGAAASPDDAGRELDRRLTVSRRLLEIHGGSLDMGASHGGAVCVSLPVAAQRRVLIVDDNPDFILLLERYLRGYPYQVIQAGDAEGALRLARDAAPDVIVLDVLMPSQDGWDILQHLRRFDELSDVPIIICSVLSDPTLATSLGADYVLTKPVTQRALLSALEAPRASPATSQESSSSRGRTPPA